MSALIKLNVGVVLKHVLDFEPVLSDSYDDSDEDEDVSIEDADDVMGFVSDAARGEINDDLTTMQNGSTDAEPGRRMTNGFTSSGDTPRSPGQPANKASAKSIFLGPEQLKGILKVGNRKLNNQLGQRRDPFGADLLDFRGPELINGSRSFLLFHKIIGQLNWVGLPLWFSLIYKIALISFSFYISFYRMVERFYSMNLINEDYRNPIFIFISCIALLTCVSQAIITFRTNLYDLCPMYKILTTPKLSFIKVKVQYLLGSESLGLILVFLVYNGSLCSLLMHRSLEDFIDSFSLPMFLMELFAITVCSFGFIGTALIDLYIRSALGHWLLALKSHLENRFMYMHHRQRRFRRNKGSHLRNDSTTGPRIMNGSSGAILENNRLSAATTTSDTMSFSAGRSAENPFNFITFDEIQRSLNNMDDHLEVLRSVQIGCLVHVSLNAFLANGAVFLLAYHLLVNQSNLYHSSIVSLIGVNCIFVVFACYSGDRWIYYALSSFVQTVEDEYFMQSDTGKSMAVISEQVPMDGPNMIGSGEPASPNSDYTTSSLMTSSVFHIAESNRHAAHQMLLIKKKDVLFCREFLHQFENHLATPWSKLTVKSHLHMLRTFVTLIAALIIFDHEH